MPAKIRIGIIGWNYPEWRGKVYDAKAKPADFLAQYATRYAIVEAASSYYGMPTTKSVAKWAAQTPSDFTVSMKVPDWLLKKDPRDADTARALGVLLEHVEPLRAAGKLGALVAQFHPSYRYEKRHADLEAFVAALPTRVQWAIELRDASWWRAETYRLLEDAGVTLVWSALADGFRTPTMVTSHSLYLRLFGDRSLGPPYDAKRRDAHHELAVWVERIESAASSVETIDILVSKYLEGYAPGTVATLAEMLGVEPEARAPRPGNSRQTTFAMAPEQDDA